MGLFKQKRRSSNEDLTILDSNEFNNFMLPELPTPKSNFIKSHKPQASNVSKFSKMSDKSQESLKIITSATVAGETERHHIMEEQLTYLSQQASLALDQLNEANKENKKLRAENDQLKESYSRYSLGRDSSMSTLNSSIFSNNNNNRNRYHGRDMSISQESSVSSNLSSRLSHTLEKHQLQTQAHKQEISNQFQEIESLKTQLDQQHQELQRLTEKIAKYETFIIDLTNEMTDLKQDREEYKSRFSQLKNSIFKEKKQHSLELVYYKNQLNETLIQLRASNEKNLKLRERFFGFQQQFSASHSSAVY
ncbi:hypothetical protein WICPIJ_002889 [Wickerhamomyces pijperi]|uniref:Uncharacterized protein n=1 Tax=Wickerhamomyces pijperi TaxID=599730 RepID=A0A9P8TNI3_WICPI|nr:hypothetical protein WICPIJ_002889 [Wickerhamomyces pijperi]